MIDEVFAALPGFTDCCRRLPNFNGTRPRFYWPVTEFSCAAVFFRSGFPHPHSRCDMQSFRWVHVGDLGFSFTGYFYWVFPFYLFHEGVGGGSAKRPTPQWRYRVVFFFFFFLVFFCCRVFPFVGRGTAFCWRPPCGHCHCRCWNGSLTRTLPHSRATYPQNRIPTVPSIHQKKLMWYNSAIKDVLFFWPLVFHDEFVSGRTSSVWNVKPVNWCRRCAFRWRQRCVRATWSWTSARTISRSA